MKNFVIILLTIMTVLAFLGFWPTYFNNFDFDNESLSVHIHGLLMFLWMLMLVSQAVLIRRKLFKWHILTGKTSYVISPLAIMSGLFVSYEVMRSGGENPPRIFFEVFTLGFTTIICFAIFYFLAIFYRNRPKLHMRFMIGTGFVLLAAGLLRVVQYFVPGELGFSESTIIAFILVELMIIALVIKDNVSGMKLSPYLIVLALISTAHLLFWLGPDWEWWRNISMFIGGNH